MVQPQSPTWTTRDRCISAGCRRRQTSSSKVARPCVVKVHVSTPPFGIPLNLPMCLIWVSKSCGLPSAFLLAFGEAHHAGTADGGLGWRYGETDSLLYAWCYLSKKRITSCLHSWHGRPRRQQWELILKKHAVPSWIGTYLPPY